MAGLRYELLHGRQIAAWIDPLAALRLSVFHDWPYLYHGTLDYERDYLDTYCRSPQSLAVLVWDGEACVAATTALPLSQAQPEMREPFRRAGIADDGILYFGESLVLPAHRGLGIGLRFFDERETHARRLGLRRCAFCAVDRPAQHPLKPADHVPNDGFWERRGYARQPELVCHYDWQDCDQTGPSSHSLTYWLKDL